MPDSFDVNKSIKIMNNKDFDERNKNVITVFKMYENHVNYLLNIVTNLHTFYNLPINPDTGRPVRSSFFEYMLIMGGMACIARTPDFGVIVSPCSVIGNYNIYGEPNILKLVSTSTTYSSFFNGIDIEVKKPNFAFFRNDNLTSPLYPLVQQTAYMLTTTLYGMDRNIGQQKFPNIIKGTSDTKLSIQHTIAKIDGYEPYVVIRDDGSFNPENAKIFNTNLPFVSDKMYQSYVDILNNFFMRVGINILPNAKKERMLVDEVNSNNQAIRSVADVYFNNRVEGCEIANALFPELGGMRVERNNEFISSVEKTNPETVIQQMSGGD